MTRSGAYEMRYAGEVVRVTPSLDERSRTLGLVVRVRNATTAERLADRHAPELRPGAFCEVRVRSNQPLATISVPNAALVDSSVFCITDQNRVQRRDVQIGFEVQGRTTITSGLGDGDVVILNPAASLIDHQLVTPIFTEPEDALQARQSTVSTKRFSDKPGPSMPADGAVQQGGRR